MQPLSKEEVDRILGNNLEEEFDKLAATPGFVLKPMPFQQVLQEWSSMQDYIQWKVFEWPISAAQGGRKKIQIPSTMPDPPVIVWRPNDFPYYVEEGISHDNIWSTTPLSTEQLTEVIERQLGPTRKYTYFINPGPLASIPGVWHAHCMHTAA